MKALTLEDLRKHFGGLPALDGVSMTAPPGRITGLIGPNGAGKTTVVNLIAGLLKVNSGRILVGDDDVTAADAQTVARVGVARTFQNIRLIPEATVLANVLVGYHRHEKSSGVANLLRLPSAIHERRAFEQTALVLLQRFGMSAFADHPAGSLSYGHQRRIEMMRALATDPAVLLLDEPVAGMNDAEAHGLADIFRSVAQEGVAILLIEHNMRFVMSLCSHIYVLASGRVIAEGDPQAIGRHCKVVEAYLGT